MPNCPLVCQCSLALSEHPRSASDEAVEIWHRKSSLYKPADQGFLVNCGIAIVLYVY